VIDDVGDTAANGKPLAFQPAGLEESATVSCLNILPTFNILTICYYIALYSLSFPV
jgi:hypothetical protein